MGFCIHIHLIFPKSHQNLRTSKVNSFVNNSHITVMPLENIVKSFWPPPSCNWVLRVGKNHKEAFSITLRTSQ